MSLQACRECGKEISRDAEACPHCGAPVSRVRITVGTVMQLVLLALAVGLTGPLVKQEFFASNNRDDDAATLASAAADDSSNRPATKRRTSRATLDCGSEEVQRRVTQIWREEVAQALSSKPAVPLDSARRSAARMKLTLTAFQILDEDRAAGVMQCAAVVTVAEGESFEASDSQVTYRIELVNQGRSAAVTLVYARIPPV